MNAVDELGRTAVAPIDRERAATVNVAAHSLVPEGHTNNG
jgi:hypothetical protein